MKLKTRITWICCLAVLVATVSTNIIIWNAQKKNLQKEALNAAIENTYSLVKDFEYTFYYDLARDSVTDVTDPELAYFFKTRNNDYDICVRQDSSGDTEMKYKVIYNHTILDEQTLRGADYKWNSADMHYAYLEIQEIDYIICQYDILTLSLYHVEDIGYVKEKLDTLTLFMVVITVLILWVMGLLVSLIMHHTLKSMKELQVTAEDMAAGNYRKRVTVRGRDEVAMLGCSFNRMAEAVEARTKTLEDSERKKTMFMANLTHELKTPLAAISGYAQTLLAVKLPEEEREEALLYIDEECRRLSRLSRKMMRLLELDTEEKLELADVPAEQLFEKAKKLCGGSLQEKNLTLEWEKTTASFWVDEDLMLEVLVNLIDNAGKASVPGQKIELSATKDCMIVRDYGCGIPREEQQKILEPFYMIDKSRSRKNGGAGLGLALTAMILKRHGILLEIESEPDSGTCMILHISNSGQ